MASQIVKELQVMNENTWFQIGQVAENMSDPDKALAAYENCLRHNPYSEKTLTIIASLCRSQEKYAKAAEYFQRILKLHESNGEVWGALGHCYLMLDDLHKAYSAYQQALYHLPNPKEPKLWYGIGILYDRYGSFEHAEDAFSAVIEMDPNFEKANEIYFRLGIIYKQEGKYENSLECFKYILNCPPSPLTELDIWFQIGHLYEQQKEYGKAREAYERVLAESPKHAKVLQQLGWLYHISNSGFTNQDAAISHLTRSIESDQTDAQSFYFLGRCYMAQQKYNDAYNAYQQAVYRDGRNPTFWCSIGVLYYQINQYSDALDAYSRAIRLNPYISEVWFDLGTLYESCENQQSDALDAYTKALEIDPNNALIKQRIQYLKNPNNGENPPQLQPQQPAPQDTAPPKYPNAGGSAPVNFRSPHLPERPSSNQQQQPRKVGQKPVLNGGGPTSFNQLANPNPPPPGQKPQRPPPQQQSRPMMLGPQLNRAGLPDEKEEAPQTGKRRLTPIDGPDMKRYKPPQ
ncbi:hypothetical protein HDV04_003566 [Boothiomyces sp. JEL0838]|nr:hypothetical protein HDV04_003566 [Boothiomyces sp. JEL0838]